MQDTLCHATLCETNSMELEHKNCNACRFLKDASRQINYPFNYFDSPFVFTWLHSIVFAVPFKIDSICFQFLFSISKKNSPVVDSPLCLTYSLCKTDSLSYFNSSAFLTFILDINDIYSVRSAKVMQFNNDKNLEKTGSEKPEYLCVTVQWRSDVRCLLLLYLIDSTEVNSNFQPV